MKKILYTLGVALVSVSSVFAQVDRTKPPKSLPQSAINFGKTENFTLSNGLKVIVVENHKLPRVRTLIQLDLDGVKEGNKAGMLEMFGEMLRAGTKNFTKEQLDEKIDFLGSDFYYSSAQLGVSALKSQLTPSLDIVQELLYNPTFSNQNELDKLKKQWKTALEADEKSPDAISDRVRKVLLYGKDDMWGEYKTPETIDNITLGDFKNYYNTYFKPNIAYLTFVGDITPAEAKTLAEKYFSSWKKGEVKQSIPALKPNTSGVSIAFVDLPSATQSVISVSNLINIKKADKNYFPDILGNSILGDGSSGRLFKDLREKHGWTYGAYSRFSDSYRRMGNFLATAKVRNNVTDSAAAAFISNIADITTNAPTADELSTKKAEYTGNFVLSLERPETVANFAYNQFCENLPDDFYKNYLKNINAVEAAQIPTALNQTIDLKNLTILIIGKGEEVLPSLEKLGYPIKYFDKYGNPTEKPAGKKASDVSLKQVLDKYITAVAGSRAKAESLKSLSLDGEMSIAQLPQPIAVTSKFSYPNKEITILSLMGQSLKQGFDGTNAITSPMSPAPSADELQKMKNRKGYFNELYYDDTNAKVDGIVSLNGKDAYKVVITINGVQAVSYYDAESGLKIKEESVAGGSTAHVEYADYKIFDGYKLPTKSVMSTEGQEMTLTVKNYQINPKLTDADFK
ncbi:MAG: insulinase family protein [Flavobacteriaceae bacterium]|jgi:predicted Zn-dependent peptidase|nr:insulinase family protein [Flavobacteriaceae bacterium]